MADFFGNSGVDILTGGNGNDRLYGFGGGDYLFGAGYRDKLFGGAGEDWLWGEHGADFLSGGNGFDIAAYYGVFRGVTADMLKPGKIPVRPKATPITALKVCTAQISMMF